MFFSTKHVPNWTLFFIFIKNFCALPFLIQDATLLLSKHDTAVQVGTLVANRSVAVLGTVQYISSFQH